MNSISIEEVVDVHVLTYSSDKVKENTIFTKMKVEVNIKNIYVVHETVKEMISFYRKFKLISIFMKRENNVFCSYRHTRIRLCWNNSC